MKTSNKNVVIELRKRPIFHIAQSIGIKKGYEFLLDDVFRTQIFCLSLEKGKTKQKINIFTSLILYNNNFYYFILWS